MCVIYFPLAAQRADSLQWVTHSAAFRGRTGLQFTHMHTRTHSCHACADSHTVDRPSCARVINDFLWLASTGLSIVSPLFEGARPLAAPRHSPFHERPPFGKDGFWVNSSPKEQEVLAAGRQREKGGFHDTICFNTVQRLCRQGMRSSSATCGTASCCLLRLQQIVTGVGQPLCIDMVEGINDCQTSRKLGFWWMFADASWRRRCLSQ